MTAPPVSTLPAFLPEQLAAGQPGSAADDVEHVHQRADVGARPTRSAAPTYGEPQPGADQHAATATGTGSWTPGPAPSTSAIPKLREGSLLPGLAAGAAPPGRAALTTVVATCYLLGVSTRRMEKLVETLGHHRAVEVAGVA